MRSNYVSLFSKRFPTQEHFVIPTSCSFWNSAIH